MFGKKDEYKNILLFKKGNALVSVSSGWPYKWAVRKKRPGHMLYCYKDYGRQRRRRVVNTDCFGNSSKSQGSETFVAEKKLKTGYILCTRVKHWQKKDWLTIKHITLFGFLKPKKSVIV